MIAEPRSIVSPSALAGIAARAESEVRDENNFRVKFGQALPTTVDWDRAQCEAFTAELPNRAAAFVLHMHGSPIEHFNPLLACALRARMPAVELAKIIRNRAWRWGPGAA